MTTPASKSDMLNHALGLHRSGRFTEAVAAYRELLVLAPENPQVLDLLGMALTSVGDINEGRRHLEKAIMIAPATASYHHDLAINYRRGGDFPRAAMQLDRALSLAPATPTYVAAKAELEIMQGKFDEAFVTLEPALGQAGSVPAVALVFGTLAPRLKREREAIAALEQCLTQSSAAAQRTKILFRIGDLYDKLGEHDAAFDAYRRGNESHPARFDAGAHERAINGLIAAWTKDRIAKLPKSNLLGTRAVFVVGMPRSGTTLVEQILAASPEICPAGELSDIVQIVRMLQNDPGAPYGIFTNFDRLTIETASSAAARYLNATKRLTPGNRIVVDKMPFNFMHLGLIQQMLPGAKIIHCTRDPMDIGLSCYTHHFDGNLTFAYDLTAIGQFYRGYERLMNHWKSVLSIPILDVPYEEMVANSETVSRKLYEFVGIPWTDKALQFHTLDRAALTNSNQQVREPIYTRAVSRWKAYEKHLGALREALAAR